VQLDAGNEFRIEIQAVTQARDHFSKQAKQVSAQLKDCRATLTARIDAEIKAKLEADTYKCEMALQLKALSARNDALTAEPTPLKGTETLDQASVSRCATTTQLGSGLCALNTAVRQHDRGSQLKEQTNSTTTSLILLAAWFVSSMCFDCLVPPHLEAHTQITISTLLTVVLYGLALVVMCMRPGRLGSLSLVAVQAARGLALCMSRHDYYAAILCITVIVVCLDRLGSPHIKLVRAYFGEAKISGTHNKKSEVVAVTTVTSTTISLDTVVASKKSRKQTKRVKQQAHAAH